MDVEVKNEKLSFGPEAYGKVSVDINLTDYLNGYLSSTLLRPINEFIQRPQKSVRSDLVNIGVRWMLGRGMGDDKELESLQFILEALHSGSLIVDDIQDGSLIRRDQPCLHILQGIPRALNAGNWLYFWAMDKVNELEVSETEKSRLLNYIQKTLYNGHIGQALDLGLPIQLVPREEIHNLCMTTMTLKTGVLTGLAMSIGPLAFGASEKEVEEVYGIGKDLGLILQIFDDLKNCKIRSGYEADQTKQLEDLMNRRPSYIWSFAARNCSKEEFSELVEAVERLPNVNQLRNWISSCSFETRALNELGHRQSQLNLKIDALEKKHKSHFKIKKPLDTIFEKLESSYEKI